MGSSAKLEDQTFPTMAPKKKVKTADDKFITVGADHDLFQCLVAKAREIRLQDVVPFSLAYTGGTL